MSNYWDKFKSSLSGLKDLSAVGIVDIVSNGIAALFWLYIASALGAEKYGEISYFLAGASIASIIALLGAENTLTVYTAKNVRIQSSIYAIVMTSTSISSIVVFFILQKLEVSLLVIGYVVFALSISEILGRKLFQQYAKYVITQKILMVGLGIGLYYVLGNQGVILGIALSSFPYAYRIYKSFRKTRVDFTLIKPRISFMMTSYVTNLSDAFGGSIDKIIIAPMLGFMLLGNYQLGMQFLSILHILPSIVYKYILPHDASGNPNKRLKQLAILVSGGISALGFFVTPLLIPHIFPKYIEAVEIIQILSFSLVPSTVSLMYTSKFLGHEKNLFLFIGSIIYLASQTALIIVLGQVYGANGAAAAFDIAVCIHMIYFVGIDRFVKRVST